MSDEDLFLMANKELENGEKYEALWVKSLALVGGDKEKAKHQYILLRVEQLKTKKGSTEEIKHIDGPIIAVFILLL